MKGMKGMKTSRGYTMKTTATIYIKGNLVMYKGIEEIEGFFVFEKKQTHTIFSLQSLQSLQNRSLKII